MKRRIIKSGLRAILPPNRVHKEKREELIKKELDNLVKQVLQERKSK